MGVTIKDVAKAAGVSRTTISFYLNGKFQSMSDETRKKIEKVIEDLNYKPSSMAQGLKTKKSGLIGLIVADITNPFTALLVKGVNDKCVEKGYQLIVANTDNDLEKEKEYIKSLLQRQAEGLIVNTAGDNLEMLNKLKSDGNKIILADRIFKNCKFDFVTTDNEEVTFNTVETLYSLGFEEIGFFTFPIDNNSTRLRRYESFKDATKKLTGKEEENMYIVSDQQEMNEKIQEFTQKYKGKKKAAFIVNGVAMLSFIQGTVDLGLSIPNDIGVCGFDDWGWNKVVGSGISAISLPSYEIGNKCAEILISRILEEISNPVPLQITLKSQLILRGSTQVN